MTFQVGEGRRLHKTSANVATLLKILAKVTPSWLDSKKWGQLAKIIVCRSAESLATLGGLVQSVGYEAKLPGFQPRLFHAPAA